MPSADPLSLSLDLLRRLPPTNISKNLDVLVSLCPSLADDLYSSVDQPLRVRVDNSKVGAGREYLACDYNRDGDSWRSPWSNEYDPPLDDGTKPSKTLRDLEVRMGSAMESYRQLYYDTGLSSVYLWDLDDGAFAGVVLFKKDLDPSTSSDTTNIGTLGLWDSLHVFEATPDRSGRSASYKLTSTVMLSLGRRDTKGSSSNTEPVSPSQPRLGSLSLSGSLTRQSESDAPLRDGSISHIANLGKMIEDMENRIRSQVGEIYFGKTKDVLGMLRSKESLETQRREKELRKELMGMWKR